jgi:hypothetical protein
VPDFNDTRMKLTDPIPLPEAVLPITEVTMTRGPRALEGEVRG